MDIDDYSAPHDVDDLTLAFPARLGSLIPPMDCIPAAYPNQRNWQDFQHRWFSGTLPSDCAVHPAAGIDVRAAIRHLSAIQGSFEPKHEHKVAAVGWLASRWLSCIVGNGGHYTCPLTA